MSTQEIVSHFNTSGKENLRKFSWKEYIILAAAGLLGAIASLPTAWSTIAKTAARANVPGMPGFSSVISQTLGWKGFLASFYGDITEEILSHLFFLTLLAWIFS